MKTLKEIIWNNSTRYSKEENVLSTTDALLSVKEWLTQKRQEHYNNCSSEICNQDAIYNELLEELKEK